MDLALVDDPNNGEGPTMYTDFLLEDLSNKVLPLPSIYNAILTQHAS